MCSKKTLGIVALVIGFLYLLQDFGAIGFDLNPWSLVFILVGLLLTHKGGCGCGCMSCGPVQEAPAPKKKTSKKK